MGFTEYLITVVGAATAGMCADILNESFSKRHKCVEKYIKYGITLCVAACIVIPLLGAFKNITWTAGKIDIKYKADNATEYDSLYILEEECALNLSEEITEKTGIKPHNISIKLEMKDGNPAVADAKIEVPEGCGRLNEISEIVLAALGTDNYIITEQ